MKILWKELVEGYKYLKSVETEMDENVLLLEIFKNI